MKSIRQYTAAMPVPEGYVDVPAYDITHPGLGTAYTQDFSISADGWTGDSGTTATRVDAGTAHSGSYALNVNHPGTSPYVGSAGRTITGLTVGVPYTFTAWAKLPASSGTNQAKISVDGITAPAFTTLTNNVWQQLTYSFTATATSHTLRLSHNNTGASMLLWDDLVLAQPTWTEHVPDHTSYSLALKILDGSGSLDEGRAPYGQFTLTVALPENDSWVSLIDNRTANRRVTITAMESWRRFDQPTPTTYDNTYTFDLLMRGRVLNLNEKSVELLLETDEALLTDYQSVPSDGSTDTSARQYQISVRSIVNNCVLSKIGATLEAGTADADFTTLTSVTNLLNNPSFTADLTNVQNYAGTGGAATSSRVATGGSDGGAFNRMQITTASTTRGSVRNDYVGPQLGKTYTSIVWFRSNAARTVYLRHAYVTDGVAVYKDVKGTPVTVVTNTWTKFVLTSQAPTTGTVGAKLAVIMETAGALPVGAQFDMDQTMLVEGNGLETDGVNPLAYFDGSTAASSFYTYAWSGTANASTSTRTPRYSRDPQTLDWQPGESAYDFIRPVLDTVGLRLFCDENRKWRLVDPTYSIVNRIQLSGALPLDNVYTGRDTISKTATGPDGQPLFYSGVVVKYSWINAQGNPQTAVDTAGSPNPGPVCVVEWNRPYMGPGQAAYILSRGVGKGRTLDITARRDLSARPGMEVVTTLPLVPIQTGRVGSVSWDFGSDEMTVGTKGLTDTPANAWALAPSGRTWATAAGTWDTYTNS